MSALLVKTSADHLNEIAAHLASYEATAPELRASYSSTRPGWRVLVWRVGRAVALPPDHTELATLVMFEDAANHGAIYHVEFISEMDHLGTYEQAYLHPHAMARITAVQRLFEREASPLSTGEVLTDASARPDALGRE